jgi:hypothetical protein
LPLSQTFYRWLLGEEASLGLSDLAYVNPSIHKTLVRLRHVVNQYNDIITNNDSQEEKTNKVLIFLYKINLKTEEL